MHLAMLADDEDRSRDAAAASRIWTMLSTLDPNLTKNWRTARPSIYDENYPLSIGVLEGGAGAGVTHILDLSVHYGSASTAGPGRFEAIYRPPGATRPEELGVLQGVTANEYVTFQYRFAEGAWRTCTYSWSLDYSEVGPVAIADVNAAFDDSVVNIVGDRSLTFDVRILDAIGALPQPIAELVAWHLAPPTLEDRLTRRSLIGP